ncbi:MAG: acetylglutamate kinase [Pseudomonadota bacterium]
MTPNRHIRQTIVQLLSNMSDGKEIRSYLQRFSEVDQSRFAVIKIGGAILAEQLEETAAALAFLHTVGLTPIVLHGGGPQLDAALAAAKIETPKVDGLRVTHAEALDVARAVFVGENIKLVEAVRRHGVDAHSVSAGVVEADYLDKDKFGFVGEPREVRLDLMRSIVASGAVPVLTCLGVAPGGQLVNVNADAATRALVHALQPMKIIFLTGVGGLLDENGAVIHSINLATDYDELAAKPFVHSGMLLKLKEIRRLLDDAPPTSSVSITDPQGLIRELFTHGGSGTLVRRGERIRKTTDKADVDAARMAGLVEQAFARPLLPGWWDGVDLHAAYFSETYRAGALVSRLGEVAYLDKFAVVEDARGEGVSRTVWRMMADDNPQLCWRSRTDNAFNAFYADVSTGCVKVGPWTVFWRGDFSFDALSRLVPQVACLPESFEERRA